MHSPFIEKPYDTVCFIGHLPNVILFSYLCSVTKWSGWRLLSPLLETLCTLISAVGNVCGSFLDLYHSKYLQWAVCVFVSGGEFY